MFGEPFFRLRQRGGRELYRVVDVSVPIAEHLDEDVILSIGILRVKHVFVELPGICRHLARINRRLSWRTVVGTGLIALLGRIRPQNICAPVTILECSTPDAIHRSR
jgi:hypothetical protein